MANAAEQGAVLRSVGWSLIRFLSNISLAISAICVLLWISGFFSDINVRVHIEDSTTSWTLELWTVRGGIEYHHDTRGPSASPERFRWTFHIRGGQGMGPSLPTLGPGFGGPLSFPTRIRGGRFIVILPWYPFVLATAIFPLWRIRRVRGRQRAIRLKSEGKCTNCEYDLRASPQQCPECGQPTGMEN
jgi:hypothetical protein